MELKVINTALFSNQNIQAEENVKKKKYRHSPPMELS